MNDKNRIPSSVPCNIVIDQPLGCPSSVSCSVSSRPRGAPGWANLRAPLCAFENIFCGPGSQYPGEQLCTIWRRIPRWAPTTTWVSVKPLEERRTNQDSKTKIKHSRTDPVHLVRGFIKWRNFFLCGLVLVGDLIFRAFCHLGVLVNESYDTNFLLLISVNECNKKWNA